MNLMAVSSPTRLSYRTWRDRGRAGRAWVGIQAGRQAWEGGKGGGGWGGGSRPVVLGREAVGRQVGRQAGSPRQLDRAASVPPQPAPRAQANVRRCPSKPDPGASCPSPHPRTLPPRGGAAQGRTHLVSHNRAQPAVQLVSDALSGRDGCHAARLRHANRPRPLREQFGPKAGLVQELGHLSARGRARAFWWVVGRRARRGS